MTQDHVKKNYTLNCTQEVINKAKRNDSRHCMVAIAIREQIPGAWSINVNAQGVRFNIGGKSRVRSDEPGVRYFYPAPALVSQKVIRFDDGVRVRPFSFRLHATQCYTSPVVKVGPRPPKGQSRPRKVSTARCTTRRYHGIQTVEKT